MRNALLSALLLLFAVPTLAQTSNLDELPLPVLRQKLATSANDTNRVKIQLALGHLMFFKPTKGQKEADTATRLAADAEALSRRLNYHFGIINAMLLSAETFYDRKDRETGLKVAQNALTFAQTHHNNDGQARAYNLISQYYSDTDPIELRNRIFYLYKAIAIFRKERNALWLSYLLTTNANLLFQAERTTEGLKLLFEALNLGKGVSRRTVEGIYMNIANTSFRQGDYQSALRYNFFALKTAAEVRDTSMQASYINHAIASAYVKLQDHSKAIPYALEAVRMAKRYNQTRFANTASSTLALAYTHTNKLPKALALLNEMKRQAYSDPDKLSVRVDLLNNLVYAKHFAQAADYAREVKELLAGIPPHNITDLMNGYNSLASYYSETGQAKLAYQYADLHAAMARKLNYLAGIRTAESRYYKLVTLKGDLKLAMEHFLKQQEIKDSIDNIAKEYQISLLRIENETLEKNKHIDSLTRETQISDIKLKRNQLISSVTAVVSLMLLIITALIYSRYRLKQRSNALLTQQKAEIDQKNAALQLLVADKMELLEDKDELLTEKDLLLKEVNHRVKNNLQIVMSLLSSQSAYLANDEAQQAILESYNRVRSIALIHDQLYKADNIAEINLSLYIKELINSLNDSLNRKPNNIAIKCDIEDITLDVSQAIPVGIILNEAVTNALKHAFPNGRPGTITILVKKTGTFIEMRIGDNGVGLSDDVSLSTVNTLGLTLLEGLTTQLEGTFSIENNEGLAINLKFPIKVTEIHPQVLSN
ncbi:sensor histidine kinase [Mucilaginibacter pedocola]|uniref:histidine kinase n=1 Tax=Mucilaginibacter pedocola TaxID=1792845 RepID=A0A1S9PGD3_9SPHI|nr:sensor histidine kinase [Mucilaginibacter pedocola]OOQ60025.1 hypothetical protein BC343_27235 [Mucilaginibacter pedocola]